MVLDARFKKNPYRLIPRAIFVTEDVMAVHTAMADAPSQVQGGNQLLVHTTGTYLFNADCLRWDMEKDCRILHEGFTACAQHTQALKEDV